MLKWPALWLPALITNAFQSLASIPLATNTAQGVVMVAANIAALFINAGWLRMIAQALHGERPTMEDFKSGVNGGWMSIVFGSLAFFVLIGLLAVGLGFYGDHAYHFATLENWVKLVQAATPQKQQALLQPEAIPAPVRGWMTLAMIWMVLTAIAAFLLLLWQPLVIVERLNWWRAWGRSARLTLAQFRRVLLFAVLNGVTFVLSLSLMGTGNEVLEFVGLVALLVVLVYFKILYTAIVVDSSSHGEVETLA
ncbi:MAG TPA: hypothetical protein V6D47_12260 [Oscillatoriaceae cyanobacterium]